MEAEGDALSRLKIFIENHMSLLVREAGLKETGMLTSCSDYHIFNKLKFKSRKECMDSYCEVVAAAYEAGVKAPRPVAYYPDLGGREAFAMERVRGETIGRRIVREPPPGLPVQLAEELARVHAIAPSRVPFLTGSDPVARMQQELDTVDEPHPAIEYGLAWLRERAPEPLPAVVSHGDFRIGNVVVDEGGVVVFDDYQFSSVAAVVAYALKNFHYEVLPCDQPRFAALRKVKHDDRGWEAYGQF